MPSAEGVLSIPEAVAEHPLGCGANSGTRPEDRVSVPRSYTFRWDRFTREIIGVGLSIRPVLKEGGWCRQDVPGQPDFRLRYDRGGHNMLCPYIITVLQWCQCPRPVVSAARQPFAHHNEWR